MRQITVCLQCNRQFSDSKHLDRKFCSHNCAVRHRTKTPHPERHTCLDCGNSFVDKRHPDRKYCCLRCAMNARQNRKTHICEKCGKSFQTKSYRKPHFCSWECANIKQGIHYHTFYCENCGKSFPEWPSREHRFCSPTCANAFQRGANSVHWRGGAASYRGENWPQQSQFARKRDNYTCQICGVRYTSNRKWRTDVHHVVPFREFGGDWHCANQLTNLIVLCKGCHKLVELGKIPCPRRLC